MFVDWLKKTVETSIRLVLHLTEIRKGPLPSMSEALLLQPTRQTRCYWQWPLRRNRITYTNWTRSVHTRNIHLTFYIASWILDIRPKVGVLISDSNFARITITIKYFPPPSPNFSTFVAKNTTTHVLKHSNKRKVTKRHFSQMKRHKKQHKTIEYNHNQV